MDFDVRLKELRTAQNLTQNELGNLLHISRATIAGYETKNKQPDYEKLCAIADFFNVSTDYLLGRTNNRQAPDSLALSPDQQNLLELYNQLSERFQGQLQERAKILLEQQEKHEA